MATAIGLGVQFTANANGMTKGLTQADRAIQNLAKQASQAARLFDGFTSSSTAAAASQQQVATDIAFLGSALKTGQILAEQYTAELRNITSAAQQQAAAFAEAARLNEANLSAEEKRASTVARLNQLYETAGLSITAYNAEMIKATGIAEQAAASMAARNAEVARAEKEALAAYEAARRQRLEVERAAQQEEARFLERGAQLRLLAITPIQEYDRAVVELLAHKEAATINDEQYQRLLEQETQKFIRAESAAKGYGKAIQAAGDGGALKFNELSGALALLPGPIGNVAGRLSGLASAGEGLSRVFVGGATEGLAALGASVTRLINPLTIGAAAVTGFGVAAVSVSRGLVTLENEVERLGQLADRLGVSFRFIQVLETAANNSGSSIEALGGGFTKFLQAVDKAREGSNSTAKAFSSLGISANDLQQQVPEELFSRVASEISAIQDPARRAATAVALFGKSGNELLPVFGQLGNAAVDLERVGAALNERQRSQVQEFGDAIDRLGTSAVGLRRQVVAAFADFGTVIASSLADATGALAKFAQRQAQFNATQRELTELTSRWKEVSAGPVTEAARQAVQAGNTADQVLSALKENFNDLGAALRNNIGDTTATDEQFAAASRLAKSIEDLAAASEEGGASQKALDAAVAESVRLFSQQAEAAGMSEDQIKAFSDSAVAALERETDAQKKAADEAQKAAEEKIAAAERAAQAQIDADRRRADSFMQSQDIGAESEAIRNAEDLAAITRQIEEIEAAIVEARARGDKEAETAAIKRLAILDQAQAAAQQRVEIGFSAQDVRQTIDTVRGGLDSVFTFDNFQIAPEAFAQAQAQLAELQQKLEAKVIDPKTFEVAGEAIREGFEDALNAARKIADLNERYAERAAEIDQERARDLSRVSREPLKIEDVRTEGGASEFIRLATGREDPAVEESRKQLRELEKIAREIQKLGGTVEIVGA
jgi:hypothetical protein